MPWHDTCAFLAPSVVHQHVVNGPPTVPSKHVGVHWWETDVPKPWFLPWSGTIGGPRMPQTTRRLTIDGAMHGLAPWLVLFTLIYGVLLWFECEFFVLYN